MKTTPLLLSTTLAWLFIGCGPSLEPQLEANKAVVERFVEVMNSQDFDLLDDLVAPDLVRHSQATPELNIRSLEEFKQFLQQTLEAFPDTHQEINMMIAEGDKVAVYATLTGTQKGTMGPFPASGKQVSSQFLGILRVEEGKIAEIWVEWDNLAMLTQLVHFPPPQEGEQ